MHELLRIWVTRLEDDLSGFADPGTNVDVEENGRRVTVSWMQRSRQRKEVFQLTADDDFRWEKSAPTATLCSYREFLCSEQMADLDQLASAITKGFPKELYYVPTMGEIEDTPLDASDKILTQRVQSALVSNTGQTQLLFVKGDAGAGKTTVLREVVADQAIRYLRNESKHLFLLINAQGRALSNLRDALAGELQDLRARIYSRCRAGARPAWDPRPDH